MNPVSQQYMNINFIDYGSSMRSVNIYAYTEAVYQGAYVAGMVAAFNSDSEKIGMVVDPSMLYTVQVVDAAALGTQIVYSTAQLVTATAHADSEIDKAVDALAAQGCEVIISYTASGETVDYCGKKGIKVIGNLDYTADSADHDTMLMYYYSSRDSFYLSQYKAMQLDTWQPESYMGTLGNGVICISDALPAAKDGTQDIMVFGSNGKVLRFDENEVRPMGRAARGVLTMKLPEGHKCISMFAVHADTNMEVLTVCANGYGKRTPLADHPKHGRRSQGQIAIMTSERNGELVAATLVNVEDTVLVLTNNGRMIRTTVESIRQSGRATQGVKLMETLDEAVVSVTRVANEDSEDVSTDAESHGASALAAETTADSGEFPVPASDENGENK